MPALTRSSKATRAAALAFASAVWAAGGALAADVTALLAQAATPTVVPTDKPPVLAPAAGAIVKRAEPAFANSDIDAQLFYQLLIGEMELTAGTPGAAYELELDAARKTGDEQLYKRATDIALQARAGDQAIAAARAWRTAHPKSLDAHRYVIQLLVALNRIGEVAEPLRSLVALTPLPQRNALIATLPAFFARSTEHKAAAEAIEQALGPSVDAAPTRVSALVATGRAWRAADDPARALALAQKAAAADAKSDEPVLLALELMSTEAAAEPIVTASLLARPDNNGVRLLYARTLASSQRYAEAIAQLEQVTDRAPKVAPPWLTLGALRLELKQPAEAAVALKTFVSLVQAPAAAADAASAPNGSDGVADDADSDAEAVRQAHTSIGAADDTDGSAADRGLTAAYLMLAQAAEQQNDFAGAESWLAKVDNPQRALDVQSRRASILARQGKLAEARELIHKAPERGPEDARAKILAEVQLLREAKRWGAAFDVLATATQKAPDDTDLLYEQSMMAEKLDRMDEMERLLRRVMALKPDHQHAYNALGFSLADRNLRLPEARDLIKRALELAPNEPFITDSLGWVEYRLGNREEAIKQLRTAYKARPDPEIAAHLGEVLWAKGDRDEARSLWREARSRDNANDVLIETLARLKVDL